MNFMSESGTFGSFSNLKKNHLGFIFDNALLGMKNMPGDSNQKDVPCTPFELSSG